MKETILTKWLGHSSYIISIHTKLYPAINQTAYCLFWGMGAKITSNFVKSVRTPTPPLKKNKFDDTIKPITVPQVFAKSRKALIEIVMLQYHP